MSELAVVRIADARPLPGFRPLLRPGIVAPVMLEAEPETSFDEFARGYTAGLREAEDRFNVERTRYRTLLAACEALQPEPSEALGLLIAHTVELLVRTIVGETDIDRETLRARAERAAALVAEVDGTRTICLHPDDIDLIGPDELSLAVAGILFGMVQAATSINEQTLSFVPKLIVVALCLALFGGSILVLLADFTREMFARIPDVSR